MSGLALRCNAAGRDPTRIEQVLNNQIGNAVQLSPPGSAPPAGKEGR